MTHKDSRQLRIIEKNHTHEKWAREWMVSDDDSAASEAKSLWVSPRCASSLGATAHALTDIHFDTLSADDWALCIIKPDAKALGVKPRIEDAITRTIERSAAVLRADEVMLTTTQLDQIWPPLIDTNGAQLPPSSWWEATVEYMTSAPVDVRLIHGVGATAALLSLKAEMRQELYGVGYQADGTLPVAERVRSVIHTSNCDQELIGNILAFWSHAEINNAIAHERSKRP